MNDLQTASADLIVGRGVTKRYKDRRALDSINFAIEPGRIVGLVGPNGAGKTTLLNSLLGLQDFEGDLRVFGLDPRTSREQLMENVCFIADVAVLPRWIRTHQVIDYVEGVHPRFDRAKCLRFLDQATVRQDMKVSEMSKGMIVQLHLALVMAIDARLLVLDEPTLGLDILHRKQFYKRLLEDYFDEDKTILITTHQVEEVESILTDVIFIDHGRIALQTPLDVMGDRYTQVLTSADQVEAARALKPISEQSMPFGKSIFVFDGADRAALANLGEVRTPSVADLFVATLKGEVA